MNASWKRFFELPILLRILVSLGVAALIAFIILYILAMQRGKGAAGSPSIAIASPSASASPSPQPSKTPHGNEYIGVTVDGTADMVFTETLGIHCSGAANADVKINVDNAPGQLDPTSGVLLVKATAAMTSATKVNGTCPAPGAHVSANHTQSSKMRIGLLPGRAGAIYVEARAPELDAMLPMMRAGCARLLAAVRGHIAVDCAQIHGGLFWIANPKSGQSELNVQKCSVVHPVVGIAVLPTLEPSPAATAGTPNCTLKPNRSVEYIGSAVRGPCSAGTSIASFTCTAKGNVDLTIRTGKHKFAAGALVTPTRIVFGDIAVGSTGSQKVRVLSDPIANQPLEITSVKISPSGQGFAVSGCSNASLPPGHWCWVTVTFSPKVVATTEASVLITDNASDSPQTVTLLGTGH